MQMADKGFVAGWGLGRHVLGSNYFHYVRDPWGSYSEYSSDVDYIPVDHDWKSGDHPPEDSFYVWGPTPPAGLRLQSRDRAVELFRTPRKYRSYSGCNSGCRRRPSGWTAPGHRSCVSGTTSCASKPSGSKVCFTSPLSWRSITMVISRGAEAGAPRALGRRAVPFLPLEGQGEAALGPVRPARSPRRCRGGSTGCRAGWHWRRARAPPCSARRWRRARERRWGRRT